MPAADGLRAAGRCGFQGWRGEVSGDNPGMFRCVLVMLVWVWGVLGLWGAEVAPEAAVPRVVLKLPTENRGLVEGRLADFYQVTISGRLQSGMYGFVRSNLPEPPPYFERFHEGIDIRPVRRDPSGRPLDPVRAAAGGTVVYTNVRARASNYGLYVMIRHDYGPYQAFTTYAHLATVTVKPGQRVQAGDKIGVLGWSGNVSRRDLAHLHFEFGFMLNGEFPGWYPRFADPGDGPNEHGLYNGANFLGIDPARILVESHQGRAVTVPELFAREKVTFRVRVPARGRALDFQRRFPFLTPGGLEGPAPASWEIDCSRIGLPLRFRPSAVAVERPELVWFDESLSLQDSFTRGLVGKEGGKRVLARGGMKWASLLTWPHD